MGAAITPETADNTDEEVRIRRSELQDELSWLMQRVHRLRRILDLEPIVTPRQDRRSKRRHSRVE